jgi:hypothetical protein
MRVLSTLFMLSITFRHKVINNGACRQQVSDNLLEGR